MTISYLIFLYHHSLIMVLEQILTKHFILKECGETDVLPKQHSMWESMFTLLWIPASQFYCEVSPTSSCNQTDAVFKRQCCVFLPSFSWPPSVWRLVKFVCLFVCLIWLKYSWFTAKWLIIHNILHILFHCGLSQDTDYSSLCYTVGPCYLSIIYILVCIC